MKTKYTGNDDSPPVGRNKSTDDLISTSPKSAHLLHLDNLQASWKYPELCRRCSGCCINQKGILLIRYINIRRCDTASGNNHCLFF